VKSVGASLVCLALVACLPPRPAEPLRPRYPDMLRSANVSGTVNVSVQVDSHGSVRTVGFDSLPAAHEQFRAAARYSIRPIRFKPARTFGIARSGTARYTIDFVLVRSRRPLRPGERLSDGDTVLVCPSPRSPSHLVVCAEATISRADVTGF
jgi:TonB family protein